MDDLSGVHVLVTGATSGVGRAMAAALLEARATVAITGRDQARAEAVAVELGAGAVGMEMDVRDEHLVQVGVERCYKRLGRVDVLICNAGVGMRTFNPSVFADPQPFWRVPPAGFRDVVETKLLGAFLVVREVVPRMIEDGGGRVVCISMNEEAMEGRGLVPYGPAGAGAEALARVMAADLSGSSVTLNILLPGETTAAGMIPGDVKSETQSGLLDPAVMGPPIVWLASEQAAGLHGQRIAAAQFGSGLSHR